MAELSPGYLTYSSLRTLEVRLCGGTASTQRVGACASAEVELTWPEGKVGIPNYRGGHEKLNWHSARRGPRRRPESHSPWQKHSMPDPDKLWKTRGVERHRSSL